MDITTLKADIAKNGLEIGDLRIKRAALAKQFGEIAADRKVGEEFTQFGYPHAGRLCRITKIEGVIVGDDEPRIKVTAALVLIGGVIGKNTFYFFTPGRKA